MVTTPPLPTGNVGKAVAPLTEYPSVDEARPAEEGGPIARSGFNYQDEIAVGFLIEMLDEPAVLKVHCESHDDIVVVRSFSSSEIVAEYIQVKAGETDKLWSVADVCMLKRRKAGTSIFEVSLARDKHMETSQFRIVTLRPVVQELRILTFPKGSSGREPETAKFVALVSLLKKKRPRALSTKKHDATFWVENCYWDERHSEASMRDQHLLRVLTVSAKEGHPLLPEQAELLLNDLRARAKAAGDAKWDPDKNKKIITRADMRKWWDHRITELTEGASSASGGKLTGKMKLALLPPELIEIAKDLRRDYSAISRTPRYAASEEDEGLRAKVKASVLSLRSSFVSGELDMDGIKFHNLCLKEMEKINNDRPNGSPDRAAFLKGCMYDIADRCLLRFERPSL